MSANRHQRNRQRQRHAAPSASVAQPSRFKGLFRHLKFRHLRKNTSDEIFNSLENALENPLKTTYSLYDIVRNLGAAVPAVLTVPSALFNSGYNGYLSFFVANFHMRIITLFIVTLSLSWTFANLYKRLTRSRREIMILLCYCATFLSAFFLSACVKWIFALEISRKSPAVAGLSVLSFALAAFVTKYVFKSAAEQDFELRSQRTNILLAFSGLAAVSGCFIIMEVA
ncbi:MAG: hypothetical protein OIF56_00920 [Cohaesibacter sp.]|nr:hypothetical protein [Cohaesibacter sp.]MCV6600311.1 hypothetical protein [Cohaesibacter sp.]